MLFVDWWFSIHVNALVCKLENKDLFFIAVSVTNKMLQSTNCDKDLGKSKPYVAVHVLSIRGHQNLPLKQ